MIEMPLDRLLFAAMVRSRIAPGKPGIVQLRTLTLSVVSKVLELDQGPTGNTWLVRSRMAPGETGMEVAKRMTLCVAPQVLRFDQESLGDLCPNLENGIGIPQPCNFLFVG